MGDATQSPRDSLKRLTRRRFQEEVARELGIDLHSTDLPERDLERLEQDLHTDGEDGAES